jgi:hypothetical protein
MKLKNFIFILILFYSSILFFSEDSLAIGLSPPTHEIVFEPNTEHTFRFSVINKGPKLMNVKVNATGGLRDYISFSENEFDLKPMSYSSITVNLKLPDSLPPGITRTNIEFLDATPSPSGMFKISVGVTGAIKVFEPYPDFYATMNVEIPDINVNQQINYKVNIQNKGKKEINDGKFEIDFFDINNKSIISKKHDVENILSVKSFSINRYFNSEDLFGSGRYLAVSRFYYGDDQTIEKETYFNIGVYSFEIINSSKQLYAGQITPYKFKVKNSYNGNVDEVYGALTINDKTYTSHKFSFKPFQEKDILVYVDNLNFIDGETHDAKITLYFGGKSISQDVKLNVIEPPKQKKVELPKKNISIELTTSTILIAVVVLLIIFNIALLFKKSNKGNEEKKGKNKK